MRTITLLLCVRLAPPALMAVAQRAGFYNRVLEQIESLPGVESAGIGSELFVGGARSCGD